MTPTFHETVLKHAEETLFPAREMAGDEKEALSAYLEFFRLEKARIKEAHEAGGDGLEIAAWRSAMVDVAVRDFFENITGRDGKVPFTLLASGGYGRGLLNPGSDIDLQFLLHRSGGKDLKERISPLLTMLYDAGFEVGHGVRTTKEATKFANQDHPTKTAFFDARFIAGKQEIFDTFEESFFKECIKGKENQYLEVRSEVIRKRHQKYGRTVHRQEPQVKMGCGGLRDYHNLIWLIWMLQKSRNLEDLVASGQLSEVAHTGIVDAYHFLMRVRNELHYIQTSQSGDIMTLRLQGIIATNFNYPGKTIIKRGEQFMRDYYGHTRALYQHGTSLMQAFHLEVEPSILSPVPILGALAARFHQKSAVEFEGYQAKGQLVFPKRDPFEENPNEMMRFFLHTQQRGLKTSPEIRKLFKHHWDAIDEPFRESRSNREVFEQILQNRGLVAQVLRRMHRVGFLGRYLPEFGQLTDLVQHEFFHQYSADEHTLRCIDEVDRVLQSEEPSEAFFREVFQEMEDSVAFYIALIMHDTGRAEGVEVHEDASAVLAAQVCKRLGFWGDRLRLILFLVDHHLTFWRTATTKDISDPETISDFATAMKSRSNMEALYLFTYVDSRGTNDEAWNDWKASLMKQLYVSTCAYFDDRKAFNEKFQRPVSKTKQKVCEKLSKDYEEEIEAHFRTCPDRYFNYRGATSITRHIQLFRKFFSQLKNEGYDSLVPAIEWTKRSAEGYTLMEVAGWNRNNLLATIAGALASCKLNILSADIYLREDDVILDIFRVCTTDFQPIRTEGEIKKIESLVDQACRPSAEGKVVDFDFTDLIVEANKPSILDGPAPHFSVPQRVFLNNSLTPKATSLEIQAVDRIGLLYDIFNVLNRLEVSVLNARISTQAGAAIDRLQLVDTHSEKKITDPERLELIQAEVWKCVAVAEEAVEQI